MAHGMYNSLRLNELNFRFLNLIAKSIDIPSYIVRILRYVFSMDGDRKYTLEELEDGASYVLSSLKAFKVSLYDKSFFLLFDFFLFLFQI